MRSVGFTPSLPKRPVADATGHPTRHRFRTPEEARNLSRMLAAFFPDPARAFQGLNELLLNAVEHGNLGLGFEEKTLLLRQGKWHETIMMRSHLAPFMHRHASAELHLEEQSVSVVVRDEGHGFDWRPFMDISPERLTLPNGRGIAFARAFGFSRVQYRGRGNEVRCTQFRSVSPTTEKSGDSGPRFFPMEG